MEGAGSPVHRREVDGWRNEKPHPKGSTDGHRQSDRAKLFTPQGRGKGNSGKAVSGYDPDAIDKESRRKSGTMDVEGSGGKNATERNNRH